MSNRPRTIERFGADGHLMTVKVHSWITVMHGQEPQPIIAWHGAVHSEHCMCWTRTVPLGIIRDHNSGLHDRCPAICPVVMQQRCST